MNALVGVDLNLMVVLHALLEERSVTRAAALVGLSQPAVSNALGRLRDLLEDPILVRQGREMVPTPRALALAGPVGEALGLLDGALGLRGGFDPATSDRTFRIAATDLAEWHLIRPLLARLPEVAPRVGVEIWPTGEDPPVDELASGSLDLALGVWIRPPPALRFADLAQEGFTVVVRRDHPRVAGALDLETWIALDHVLVSARGRTSSVVDYVLDGRGLRRRFAVTVPRFLDVPWIVATTELCATLPTSVATTFADLLPLALHPPPLALPRFPLRLLWHRRTDRDPGLVWLRDQLSP